MGVSGRIHQAFGLRLCSSFALPELEEPGRPETAEVDVSAAPADVVDGAFSGSADPLVVRDGFLGSSGRYRTERGIAGDLRIEYWREARVASVHMTADGRVVRCWAANPDDPSWRRFFLGTALGTVALARGYEALHAGAFERDGIAVAVVGADGIGKSTLLAELVGRGRALVTEDVLVLSGTGRFPVAHPGPPLMNLPPRLPDGRSAADVGRVLAVMDGESWITVDRAAVRALPLGAVVLLARTGHGAATIEQAPATPALLLAHSLPSGGDPCRLDARFALFASVAASVPILRLCAPIDLPAAAIADAMEHALDRARARGSAA